MKLFALRVRSVLWPALTLSTLGLGLGMTACKGPGATMETPVAASLTVSNAGQTQAATKWDEFHRTVQPFLAKHCYECHSDENAENGVRFDLIRDAASLGENSATLEEAWRNLASHRMPPSYQPQPPDAAKEEVVGWLKTYLAGDPTGPINPGRVTLRRLNRAEYNNTIRDLLAIDLRPADAFPVDDAGYGFDNNGDVLSIAPMLLEKYLAAAELAVEKAIFSDPVVPPPLKRWEAATLDGTIPKSDPLAVTVRGGFPDPTPAPGAVNPARRGMPVGRLFSTSGEIFAEYDAPAAGEYILRVRAYGTRAGSQRPEVAFAVDGERVHEPFTVNEAQQNTSIYSLEKINLSPGRHHISLAFLNGATGGELASASARGTPANTPATAIVADNAAGATGSPASGDATTRQAGDGDPGRTGGAPPTPDKPTLGVVYIEIEGPLAPTPDRMPESYRRVMVAQPSAEVSKPQAAEEILRTFASRAFRRPVSSDELDSLMGFWRSADADGRSFERSIDVALQAILVSPAFLFRQELEPQPGETVHTLNEHELATRLSYFLWSSMPDDELFALANEGKLRAHLPAQVRRMLKDPKSAALVENFAGQWLQLRLMQNVEPDPEHFPEFDEPLRNAMIRETELFFTAIMQEDRDVLEFIDADFTFVNERLARHYALPGIVGTEFQRVELPGDRRGGLMTQASVLTMTSFPARTSPVLRGRWVLENLLDAAPPPPPPNIPALSEDGKALTGTLRQRMEQHRSNPSCASCHEQMDGIGFALENFDAVGAWRNRDAGGEIDASGAVAGGITFNGPAELRQVIKMQSDEFLACLAGKMLTYALGRGLESYDRRTTDTLVTGMKQNGNRFTALIQEIVQSDAFQKRNGRQQTGDL